MFSSFPRCLYNEYFFFLSLFLHFGHAWRLLCVWVCFSPEMFTYIRGNKIVSLDANNENKKIEPKSFCSGLFLSLAGTVHLQTWRKIDRDGPSTKLYHFQHEQYATTRECFVYAQPQTRAIAQYTQSSSAGSKNRSFVTIFLLLCLLCMYVPHLPILFCSSLFEFRSTTVAMDIQSDREEAYIGLRETAKNTKKML